MIDLTGLTPIANVVVTLKPSSVHGSGYASVKFSSKDLHEKWTADLNSLKELGCNVLTYPFSSGSEAFIYPGNYDPVAISERVASHYEKAGLSVSRQVLTAGSEAKENVQSFILL